MVTKQAVQKKLHTYKKRRDVVKKEITELGKERAKKSKILHNLSNKIRSWEITLASKNRTEEQYKDLKEKVESFTGKSILNDSLSQNLLLKYGLEYGFKGTKLQALCGYSAGSTGLAAQRRSDFTKSFETEIENKIIYYRFKGWINQPKPQEDE